MEYKAIFVILLVIMLVFVLYKDLLRPAFAFLATAFVFIVSQIISPEEFLAGLANKQIIVIFLLIGVTAGIQKNIGSGFFYRIFSEKLTPTRFRTKLMFLVGSLSALLNNTPIVAFMIPYVKEWAEKNNFPASKFLIPLSYATILGGMITVVGTSTNLVLNGLISQYGLPMLGFQDFLFIGSAVALIGISYLVFASDRLLPEREGNKTEVMAHINEYIIEAVVVGDSSIIGKSVKDAGLRSLKEIFLAEISREGREISPVSPREVLQPGDKLFFTGSTKAILELISQEKGLVLPEETYINMNGYFRLTEAVVPSTSNLIGEKIKKSDFRKRFQASIISLYRKGEKLRGNIGETKIQAGDLLLMLSGENSFQQESNKDLIVITLQDEIDARSVQNNVLPSVLAVGILLTGIVGWIDLFMAAFGGIIVLYLFRVLNLTVLRKSVDLDLLLILVCSLAIGVALKNSGAASLMVDGMLWMTDGAGVMFSISLLFVLTLVLTSMITNAAAVSIMFPMAMEMAIRLEAPFAAFFLAIAFAASGDFMTPIGYQTNLMIMGPGNYKFKDYFKIGLPLTIIYTLVTLMGIKLYFQL
ncbi:SLC13 family permease [Negadavirga shengliensis]|uniref:SLC13 family permease n=1 Tax=Negadavirga shengliensis TaxID=1389218 RepID=A0ABV9SXD7_9BACT